MATRNRPPFTFSIGQRHFSEEASWPPTCHHRLTLIDDILTNNAMPFVNFSIWSCVRITWTHSDITWSSSAWWWLTLGGHGWISPLWDTECAFTGASLVCGCGCTTASRSLDDCTGVGGTLDMTLFIRISSIGVNPLLWNCLLHQTKVYLAGLGSRVL